MFIHTKQDVMVHMKLIQDKMEKIRVKINRSPLNREELYKQFEREFRKIITFFGMD